MLDFFRKLFAGNLPPSTMHQGEDQPADEPQIYNPHIAPESSAEAAAGKAIENQRIKESEAKLRAYFEAASQGIITVGPSGGIEQVNSKIEEMFGYRREELLGQPLEILLPERYRRAHTGHRADYFANPRSRPMGVGLDLAGRRKDGSEFPVEIALSFIPMQGGDQAIGFVSDITERKRVEEQLRQTQKLESLGVLAGGVAHDFNNLLTGILGNASLALEAGSMNEFGAALVQEVITASHRASELTSQMLAYAGKGRFVVTPLDLSDLVRHISGLVQTSIPRSVQLKLHLGQDLPTIDADAGQIQQVVMNLVINGAEAIGEERTGTVTVSTRLETTERDLPLRIAAAGAPDTLRPGSYVVLEVSDDGCGMEEEMVRRIFDPFFSTKFTGRGLGLAAVQGIVRSHKGALLLESRPGAGTTFRVLFPVSPQAVPQPPQEPTENAVPVFATVLVVDDEAVVRSTARNMLEKNGCTVLLAENGKEAVAIFARDADRISVVLLDMTMPVMSGADTLYALQSIRPDVKVLLSSGYSEEEATRRFAGGQFSGFIQKPYRPSSLMDKIRKILEVRHTSRSSAAG